MHKAEEERLLELLGAFYGRKIRKQLLPEPGSRHTSESGTKPDFSLVGVRFKVDADEAGSGIGSSLVATFRVLLFFGLLPKLVNQLLRCWQPLEVAVVAQLLPLPRSSLLARYPGRPSIFCSRGTLPAT